jgi:predicted glycoside hydrolase/deacetylase ChbG (UPF0249 family)
MKMIIRADDVGYTKVCNIGAFEALEHGVSTHAEVMLDTPGSEDALERLRALPWISVGWHAHFWGSPVLDPKQVRSLVIEEAGRIRFRKDLRSADEVIFEQALLECCAQIDRCIRILGKAPDTCASLAPANRALGRAMQQACDKYGIATQFSRKQSFVDGVATYGQVSDKWASRRIYDMDMRQIGRDLRTDSVTEVEKYDPFKYFSEDRGQLRDLTKNDIAMLAWHPGYVDYFVYRLGDYGPEARNFIVGRVMDVEAMCSDRVKNWLKQNRVELLNFRDALYGTREYQNHLKRISSDLCMIQESVRE